MNNKFKWLLILLGLLFIIQGLLKFEFIPVSLAAVLLGVSYSASPINFFIYPFVYFILKFFLAIGGFKDINQFGRKIHGVFLRGNREYETPEAVKYGIHSSKIIVFRSWLVDFFIWVVAFWCSLMIAGYLTYIGYIPNNEQFMYPMMLNYFLGFTIIIKCSINK